METNAMGVKNLQFIMNNLEEWTYTPDKNYEDLQELYDQVVGQYKRYIGHVSKWVGGRLRDSSESGGRQAGQGVRGQAKQKEAMEWLDKYLFEVPTGSFRTR